MELVSGTLAFLRQNPHLFFFLLIFFFPSVQDSEQTASLTNIKSQLVTNREGPSTPTGEMNRWNMTQHWSIPEFLKSSIKSSFCKISMSVFNGRGEYLSFSTTFLSINCLLYFLELQTNEMLVNDRRLRTQTEKIGTSENESWNKLTSQTSSLSIYPWR